jgi:glycosyltransferase involved in cell wall biosynthesis
LQKILVFIDHYVPGFKFGGPVRSISNLVSRLSDHYEFYIFTSDRDLGDSEPYRDVAPDSWIQVGKARVFYSNNRSLRNIRRRAEEISPDLIYLNSFFSRVSIKMLLSRTLGLSRRVPVVLAPRGEFADGAMVIKPLRKKAYINFVNSLGLLDGITLQASTDYEKADIETHLQKGKMWSTSASMVACDISAEEVSELRQRTRNYKEQGVLRLISVARVSRNKNLKGALQILQGVSGQVSFSIYGPIIDPAYWASCQECIQKMPADIKVQYCGALNHDQVQDIFYAHDMLFLPTLGENYGHVIGESLLAGCPVLVSDKTPWRNLESVGVGADVSLSQPEKFRQWIEKFSAMDNDEYLAWSRRSLEYGLKFLQDRAPLEQNLKMFAETLTLWSNQA